MISIFRFFASRPIVANLITLTIFLVGLVTTFQINRSQFPKVDLGEMLISLPYPGASVEDVELNVTNKIEKELRSVSGIKKMVSTSMENFSSIYVVTDSDEYEIKDVKREIREALSRVNDLPKEIEEVPHVHEIITSMFPIIRVGITGDIPFRELRKLGRNFEKKLEALPGVARVERTGYNPREVQINVEPEKMAQYQISIGEIIKAISERNVRASGGYIESAASDQNIVTLAQFKEPLAVGDVIVRSSASGDHRVRLKDVAFINDGFEKAKTFPRVNGFEAISYTVIKTEKADVISTVKKIRALVEEEQALLGDRVQFLFSNDTSKKVENQFSIVMSNGMIGLAFVLVILSLFLNLRTAFWVAAGIPLAIMGVITLLPFFGLDLDGLTLTAMIIVLGIIVDDAIIISENIYKYLEKGHDPVSAAVNGLSGVFLPVLTTVLTTFLAFFPMFFMKGVLGKFTFVIPLVISLALFVSMIECLLALPSHIISGIKPGGKLPEEKQWFQPIRGWFLRQLTKILHYRWRCLGVFLVSGVLISLYGYMQMKFILFPPEGSARFQAFIEVPQGTPLKVTSAKAAELEAMIAAFSKEEVDSFSTRIGALTGLVIQRRKNYATIAVELTPFNSRKRSAEDIVEALREKSNTIKGVKSIHYVIDSGGPPTGPPILYRAIGSDEAIRKALADKVESILKEIEAVKDVRRDDRAGKSQIEIELNHEALAMRGLSVKDVAANVRFAYDGHVVTRVRYGEDDVNFRVQFGEKFRGDTQHLKNLLIPNREGQLVQLKDIAVLKEGVGPGNIKHFDAEKATSIFADLNQDLMTPGQVEAIVMGQLDLARDYPGVKLRAGGQAKESKEALQDLFITMGLALLGIYFLLILLFNSILQPLMVLVSFPFAVFGVVLTFAIHDKSLSFLAVTGIIGLVGVVVNDSLVLVAHLNSLKEKLPKDRKLTQEELIKFVAQGTSDRLRAILLTTVSTVAGLLPLAYGWGGIDVYMSPMALAMGWGLVLSTPITLVLIPILYMVLINADYKKQAVEDDELQPRIPLNKNSRVAVKDKSAAA
ncbi:MAG: acriflavin resistance protein [Zetaproteobacteria bacterium]|nr:acriflavin resistance protein [Pseudobdellovibrionaceae bacterium]